MKTVVEKPGDLSRFIPDQLTELSDPQRDLPRIAKDPKLTNAIECTLSEVPTTHTLYNLDARKIDFLAPNSVHLIVTSPPYWTLKAYRKVDGQLGWIEDYEQFLRELDRFGDLETDALRTRRSMDGECVPPEPKRRDL